jgi:hypothetical protein
VAVTGPSPRKDPLTEAGLLSSAEVMLSVGFISNMSPSDFRRCSDHFG